MNEFTAITVILALILLRFAVPAGGIFCIACLYRFILKRLGAQEEDVHKPAAV